ncbi:hypothetical protein BCR35DRAFT_201896 [Leucosporidium creatinivorum]|uniref:Uncharacterized protein n=1 Tax=Leucosporidium creatinivorum TaxID=106004 RepID=A0A1Y2DHR1_9BASI|nr:hypothetical protein BCR35DRAFT_201896 [Leucosporidium creatinivorum]
MEGVARDVIPTPSDFFDELGHLFTIKAYTISERHKEFCCMLADWAPRLPWLKEEVEGAKGKKLRKLVAENMKDIVQLRKGLEEDERRRKGVAVAKEEEVGVMKGKKEESEDDVGEEEEEDGGSDVDWDDEEGEDDPPGGPSNFFIDPLSNPQAAADTLRAGDDQHDSTTDTADDPNPELKSTSPIPPPPNHSSWSQLAANFYQRRVEGGGGTKRPAAYMRHRPGPVKRVRTIEQVAQSLLSPFAADETTTTPSPAPPEVDTAPSPPSSSTVRPSVSASTSPPRARSASLPSTTTTSHTSIAPSRYLVDPSRANPFASHSNEAVAFRQLLLAGHDVTSIFEGTATYEPASSLKSSRLDRLLWAKTAEEVGDDELFDEGELEGIIRTEEEVEMLMQTEKWRTMPEAKPPLTAEEGERKNPRVRKKARTRIPRVEGPSLEEEEERERVLSGRSSRLGRPPIVAGGMGGAGQHKSRRTKVSQETKERLAKMFAAADEGEGEGEGSEEEALSLGMAMDAAATDDEADDDDSDFV